MKHKWTGKEEEAYYDGYKHGALTAVIVIAVFAIMYLVLFCMAGGQSV